MDAMSGRGELGDWGLVADLYGLDGRAKYRTGRTGADRADYGILDKADWGGLADGADCQTGAGGRAGLSGEGRTGRTQ